MDRARHKRIGVLLGGGSPEHAVSLGTGEAVVAALAERGWDVAPVYVDHDLDLVVRQARIDVAFVALHGRGADGAAQGLLETLGVPYTGPSLHAAALAGDKLRTKELLRLHNLPTPTYYCLARGAGGTLGQHAGFGFPCVVKPRTGGSGIGVALARDEAELEAAVENALRFDDDVIIERHVAGQEVHVVLIDGEVLGVAEVLSDGGLLDYATQATAGRTQVILPPRLSQERIAGAVTQAARAYDLLGASGIARVDLIISPQGNEFLLEVNALPQLGPSSLVPKLAHAAGVEFGALVERLVHGARLHHHRRGHSKPAATAPWLVEDRRVAGAVGRH